MENNSEYWWYVYVLDVDNRGNKSKYYGHTRVYYTGITTNLVRRLKEHLIRKYGYIGTYFSNARKTLVYVEYLFGTKNKAMIRESYVKRMSVLRKEALIISPFNMLVQYVPLKVIILKKNGNIDEQICLKIS